MVLALLAGAGDAPNVASTAHALPSVIPALKIPRIPMPKLRFPRLPKRNASSAAVTQTERRLKALVADQESWYAYHGQYSSNAYSAARNATRADPSLEKVQIQVLYAGKKGWTAMASHPDAPGKTCVIYVGYRSSLPLIPRTRADALDAAAEGKPTCDR